MKMKKIIAAALTAAMLFALSVPAFAAWKWMSDVNNTTNFIASVDKELPRSAGRLPEGVKVTLGGQEPSSAWQYAYPYLLDRDYTPGRYSGAADVDVYVMYDSQALYIREVRRNTLKSHTEGTNAASADYDSAVYTILVPDIVMGTTKDSKTPVGAQVKVFPTYNDDATRPVPCILDANKISYAYITDTDGNKVSAETGDLRGLEKMIGVDSYTRALTKEGSTVTSYEIETKILWNQMGVSSFTPAENTTIGFSHYINVNGQPGYVSINEATGSHNEWDNFSAMTLRGVNADAASYKIDMSWYNTDDTEFTLTTPGQLMGLSYIIGSQASIDSARAITKNKTFKLGADMDLNPDWTTDSTTPPLYYWLPLGVFEGTIDGQGHEISNMICNPQWNILKMTGKGDESWHRDMGLIGRAYGTVTVKDLAITDSTVSSYYNGGGLIARVMDTAGKVVINNVYVDADISVDTRNPSGTSNNNYSHAGILIGNSSSTAANWATVTNAACVGSIDLKVRDTGVSGVGCGPVWGTTSSSTATVSNVLIALSSNTATAYNMSTQAETSNAYRTRLVANGDNGEGTDNKWTETNTVYVDTSTGELKTNTGDSRVTNKPLAAYPSDWTEAGSLKMPETVAAMMKHNLWVQRSTKTEGESSFTVRVLSLVDAYKMDGYARVKVEVCTDGNTWNPQTATADANRYASVSASSAVKTATELGGKYIIATTVENLPAAGTVKLRVTPVYGDGQTAVANVPASLVTYIDGVLQTN